MIIYANLKVFMLYILEFYNAWRIIIVTLQAMVLIETFRAGDFNAKLGKMTFNKQFKRYFL